MTSNRPTTDDIVNAVVEDLLKNWFVYVPMSELIGPIEFKNFRTYFVSDMAVYDVKPPYRDPGNSFAQDLDSMLAMMHFKEDNVVANKAAAEFFKTYSTRFFHRIRTFDSIWLVESDTVISPVVFKLATGYTLLEVDINLEGIAKDQYFK